MPNQLHRHSRNSKRTGMTMAARTFAMVFLPISCTTPNPQGEPATADLKSSTRTAAVSYTVPTHAGPDDLARLAIRHHPSIQAARSRAERSGAAIPQAAALPDPMLDLTIGPVVGNREMRSETMIELKQPLPFPGKRRASTAAATSEAAANAAAIHTLELDLTERVHSAWWNLYLADQTAMLTRESRTVLAAVRDAVDARVAANQAGQADQLRISNEIAMIDRDLVEVDELSRTARARLNSLLNRPPGAPLPTPRPQPTPSLESLNSLVTRAQSHHPDVAAARQRANAFHHRLKRAQLEKYPDFTVGISGSRTDEIYGMIGINLPLWREPRRAMIREARAGLAETEAMLGSTRSDLRYRIEEAWFNLQSNQEIAKLFESRLIPDANQAFEITLTGYSAGSNSFTDLVETWRQILTYRLQFTRARVQMGKATATLRAAAALP